MKLIVPILLLATTAGATRVSRSSSGTAECPTKAWRVLVVGGEMQANSWCDRSYRRRVRRKQYEDKRKREREEYQAKKEREREDRKARDNKREQDRKDRIKARQERHKARELEREQERLRRERERKLREEKERERKCRGVSKAARCVKKNPGKGRK